MLRVIRSALKKRKRSSLDAANGPAGTPSCKDVPSAAGTPSECLSSAKKAVRFPRGKRCATAVGTADPDVDRTPIELPYTCDGCGNYILAARHNCGGCEDFDLCEPCFGAYRDGVVEGPKHEHPWGVFVRVPSAEEEEEAAATEDAGGKMGARAGGTREGDLSGDDRAGAEVGRGEDEGEGAGGERGGRMGPRSHVRFEEEEAEGKVTEEAPVPVAGTGALAGDDLTSHPLSPAAFRLR